MKDRDRGKSQGESDRLDQRRRSDIRQSKKRFDHPGQERLAEPAKAQAGQCDPELGCGKIGV